MNQNANEGTVGFATTIEDAPITITESKVYSQRGRQTMRDS